MGGEVARQRSRVHPQQAGHPHAGQHGAEGPKVPAARRRRPVPTRVLARRPMQRVPLPPAMPSQLLTDRTGWVRRCAASLLHLQRRLFRLHHLGAAVSARPQPRPQRLAASLPEIAPCLDPCCHLTRRRRPTPFRSLTETPSSQRLASCVAWSRSVLGESVMTVAAACMVHARLLLR